MQFNVKFESTTGYAISIPDTKYGLDLIDKVRNELQLPNLSLEVFFSNISKIEKDLTIVNLSEDMVRQSKHFKNINEIVVYVPEHYLNKFVKIDYEVHRKNNGEVVKLIPFYVIMKQKVLDLWENLGYPLEIFE